MNPSEQQSVISESNVERAEQSDVLPSDPQDSTRQRVFDSKRAIDLDIKSKVSTVQRIVESLEINNNDKPEVGALREEGSPEEIINKSRSDFLRLIKPSIDDISRILITSGLEIKDVQSWLSRNQIALGVLISSKKVLETCATELTNKSSVENQKKLLVRLFRGSNRKKISDESNEVAAKITQLDASYQGQLAHVGEVEKAVQLILSQRQELAALAVEQLFFDVGLGRHQLQEAFASPEVKKTLNEDLITAKITPELNRLQEEGKITTSVAKEYLDLLRIQFAQGSRFNPDDPIEKKQAIKERTIRLTRLNEKSDDELIEITRRVSAGENEIPDSFYDNIIDLILREASKEQVEKLRDTIASGSGSALQARIGKIADEIIYQHPETQTTTGKNNNILDIHLLPIEDFKSLKGLERWQTVKRFAVSSAAIPIEILNNVEKTIIQRLYDEQLSPGGYESWDGTRAAIEMGDIGSPKALPLMLRHIEASGPGHTNNTVVHSMEQLLKESNPEELQQILESLPASKRKLLETLADENSYMSRFGRYHFRYGTCDLLQNGDRTIRQEQYTKLLEDAKIPAQELDDFYLLKGDREKLLAQIKKVAELSGEDKKKLIDDYFQELTANIYTENVGTLKIVDVLAGELGVPREDLLVRCVERYEEPPKNQIVRLIASPVDSDYGAFPASFSRHFFGSTDTYIEKLKAIYQTNFLQVSNFEREAYLDGLLLLKKKENGKDVFETLLDKYRGAKDDSKRIRRIFQLLATLDGLGEYAFVSPDQDKEKNFNDEIADLQKEYSQTQDKAERKRIKNKIDTLTVNLQNLTGLRGIEDEMTQRVVEVACRRLALPAEYQAKIEAKLEEILKSGLLDIVSTLAGNYEAKNQPEVKKLLTNITAHIIGGDFEQWRYSHERSEQQLLGLTNEQKELWQQAQEPVTVQVELAEDERGRRSDELKAAQEIIQNVKGHIRDSQPNFDFSSERAHLLALRISQLTEKIKLSPSEEEKRQLAQEKRALHAEERLIRGIIEIENDTPDSFSRDKVLAQAKELHEKITELKLPLAGLDLEQIAKIFTVGEIKSVTAYESDDPMTLLKVGVEPQETCQSWRSGGFNECLLAYVADSNKKVLNVADENGRIVARSIVKLTKQREENDMESKTQRRTLLVEKPYSLLQDAEVYRAFVRALLMKAQGLDAAITFGKGFDEETLEVFEEEARAVGYGMDERKLDIFIPQSMNAYEYSDTLGGKISSFNRYRPLEANTFEKLKT